MINLSKICPNFFKVIVKRILSKLGFSLSPSSVHQLWLYDQDFLKLYKSIETITLIDPLRCFIIYQFLKGITNLTGDLAEVGVYKGGTAKFMAQILLNKNKTLHLFDTFTGMPKVNASFDFHREGDFSDTDLGSVRNLLKDFSQKIQMYPGFFPATANPILNHSFCFVHIDTDIYQSVKDCCSFFYPRLVAGGIFLFDDYGFKSCPGIILPRIQTTG